MNPRILVTGGTGLLGSYLLHWFKQNGYTNLTGTYQADHPKIPEQLQSGITWKQLRLPDMIDAFEVVKDHGWVIHSAAFITYDAKEKYKAIDINRDGTKHIVDACLEYDVKHFIYVGSIGALGKEKSGVTLNESAPWLENEFTTSYGLSKYLGELEAWRGKGEGLNVSVVLPSVILGTGDWHRSSLQIFERVATKPGWYPTGQTGYIDVRDLARFITLLLERNHTGDRWILNAENIPYGDLFHMIGDELGIKKTFRPAPKWLAKMILKSASLLKGKRMGSEVLNHTYGTFFYDNSKSLSLEGFLYRPLKNTIQDISRSYVSGSKDLLPF